MCDNMSLKNNYDDKKNNKQDWYWGTSQRIFIFVFTKTIFI